MKVTLLAMHELNLKTALAVRLRAAVPGAPQGYGVGDVGARFRARTGQLYAGVGTFFAPVPAGCW